MTKRRLCLIFTMCVAKLRRVGNGRHNRLMFLCGKFEERAFLPARKPSDLLCRTNGHVCSHNDSTTTFLRVQSEQLKSEVGNRAVCYQGLSYRGAPADIRQQNISRSSIFCAPASSIRMVSPSILCLVLQVLAGRPNPALFSGRTLTSGAIRSKWVTGFLAFLGVPMLFSRSPYISSTLPVISKRPPLSLWRMELLACLEK